ncbi:MAG TPA: hypothetical protein VIW24_30310, partial [Aldersonia sp.]
QPPDRDELDATYTKLKQVHAAAIDWDPPDVEGLERLPSNRMRQYVRAWINEWDLRRLDPSYVPDISAGDLVVDYSDALEGVDSDDGFGVGGGSGVAVSSDGAGDAGTSSVDGAPPGPS